jgi:hypothetical protein
MQHDYREIIGFEVYSNTYDNIFSDFFGHLAIEQLSSIQLVLQNMFDSIDSINEAK